MSERDTLAALRTSLVLIANECVQPTDQHTIPRIQSLAHDALAGVRVAPSDKDPMEGVACDWDEDGNCRCVRVAPSPDAPGLTLTSVQTPHTCGYCHGIHDPAEGAVRASAEAARAALAAQSKEPTP